MKNLHSLIGLVGVFSFFCLATLGFPVQATAAHGEAAVVTRAAQPDIDQGKIHVVQKGEKLWKIAFSYGLNPQVLYLANSHELRRGARNLQVGQHLFIPSGHLVAKGETWESLSRKFHISVPRLRKANPGMEKIRGGTSVKIPQYEDYAYRKKMLPKWDGAKVAKRLAQKRAITEGRLSERVGGVSKRILRAIQKKTVWTDINQFVFREQTDSALDKLGIAEDYTEKNKMVNAIFYSYYAKQEQPRSGSRLILLDEAGGLNLVTVQLPPAQRKTTKLKYYIFHDGIRNCSKILVRSISGQIGLVPNKCVEERLEKLLKP